MDVVADHLQQVGRPDGVFHPFLRPQSPHQPHQPALRRAAPARPSNWRRVVVGSGGIGHAVGNHPHPFGRRAVPDVEIAHALAVDHHRAAAAGQGPVQGQLQPALPRVDASLPDHESSSRRRPWPPRNRRCWRRTSSRGPDRAAAGRRARRSRQKACGSSFQRLPITAVGTPAAESSAASGPPRVRRRRAPRTRRAAARRPAGTTASPRPRGPTSE